MDADRFKEYSPGPEAALIQVNDEESVRRIEAAPALLMYERGTEGPNAGAVLFGRVSGLKVIGKQIAFRFQKFGEFARSDIEDFSSRLGVHRFEHGRTHWALKEGDIPSGLIDGLRAVDPVVSTATRNAFEDSYTDHGVLRDISSDFDEAGIEPEAPRVGGPVVGERRKLIRRYYSSVDWCLARDARKVIKAFENHVQRLRDRGNSDEVARLAMYLRRDHRRVESLRLFDGILRSITAEGGTTAVEETATTLANSFDQAHEHLKQALSHLSSPTSPRARKDGLRDCLSAMESLLKTATGTADIKDATTALRADKRWGGKPIVKDGLAIWNHIHELHPDVRHGQAASSDLNERECLYWADRIAAFVRYIARTADDVLPERRL